MVASEFKIAPPLLELSMFCSVSGLVFVENDLTKQLKESNVTKCTYVNWLAADAVRLSYINTNGVLEPVIISREILVKRVANILDGSHPSATVKQGENIFDAPIIRLTAFNVGGLPLPYFILLKVAQDILDIAPKLLNSDAPISMRNPTVSPRILSGKILSIASAVGLTLSGFQWLGSQIALTISKGNPDSEIIREMLSVAKADGYFLKIFMGDEEYPTSHLKMN